MNEDRTARARWIARHILPIEPALRAWLSRQLATSPIEVDDVVQETYAVLGELAGTDHIRSPRHYAFQTARSIVLAHYRRAKIVPFEWIGDLDQVAIGDDTPSPETQASDRADLGRVLALIEELPERQREAFRLLKLEERHQREAAAIMGISESTLEKHIAKAIHFLMDRMGRGGNVVARTSLVDHRRDRTA